MKTKLFFFSITFALIFTACSPIDSMTEIDEIEPIVEIETVDETQPDPPSNPDTDPDPNKNLSINFYPENGIHIGDDITAEYRPTESIIYITTPHRLSFDHFNSKIINQNCSGQKIVRVQGCNYHHYNIFLNEQLNNCLKGTTNGIQIKYDQYPKPSN